MHVAPTANMTSLMSSKKCRADSRFIPIIGLHLMRVMSFIFLSKSTVEKGFAGINNTKPYSPLSLTSLALSKCLRIFIFLEILTFSEAPQCRGNLIQKHQPQIYPDILYWLQGQVHQCPPRLTRRAGFNAKPEGSRRPLLLNHISLLLVP